MFNKLVASQGRKRSLATIISTSMGSLIIHGLLLLGVVSATAMAATKEKKKEELVDYMEIEEEKPAEPEVKEEEPPPPPPEPEPETPQEAPPVVKGFQELVPPEEPPQRIPDVDPTQVAAKAEDFSGVGKAGGVAQGVETGVAQDVSKRETPPEQGTYDMSTVDEQPKLSNASTVTRALERNYPPLLKDAGVTGTVTVKMRINEDGRVDASSVTIEDASNEQFGNAARKVVEQMRFRPAKVNGRPVKIMVTLPVSFTLGS